MEAQIIDHKPSAAHPKAPPKRRISANVKAAIHLMIDEGRSRREAAEACGITDDWLYRALERPECKAYRNERMRVFRESAASRSIARVDRLADKAVSEHVQLNASQWLAALEGITPVAKSEITHTHQGSIPGLTIQLIMPQQPGDDALLIADQPRALQNNSEYKDLPVPVPHPAMRNDGATAPQQEDAAPAKPGWRGAKPKRSARRG